MADDSVRFAAGSDDETPPPILHGGNLAAASARFGEPIAGWLDLSTGINPFSYPLPPLDMASWTRLPDAAAEAALIAAARRRYKASRAEIVAAAGSQTLIQRLADWRPPGRIAVVSPAYAEHARCWAAAGHEVVAFDGRELPRGADVCIVVNPNNPDGRVVGRGVLASFYERLAVRGGLLIVDEAFADVAPEISIADWAGQPGLVVLRSFGKFFGLAGVRLGFALTDRRIAARLGEALGPWAVSGPALEIGRRALIDDEWSVAMRRRLKESARRLDAMLAERGLRVRGGTDLFRLVETADAARLHAALAGDGVWTRVFDEHPDWMRIGLPGGEAAIARLALALERAFTGS